MSTKAFTRISVFSLATLLVLTSASTVRALGQTKARDLVIVRSSELPTQAREPGVTCFLHSDNAGHTYLYIEQQRGVRVAIFDVTTPAKITYVGTATLDAPAPFEVISTVDHQTELVHFRDSRGAGVLDLHNAKNPTLRKIAGIAPGDAESLGNATVLIAGKTTADVSPAAADFAIVDTAETANPTAITVIKQVTAKAVNPETQTTFLLASDGLTVIRHLSAEYEYVHSKLHASLQ